MGAGCACRPRVYTVVPVDTPLVVLVVKAVTAVVAMVAVATAAAVVPVQCETMQLWEPMAVCAVVTEQIHTACEVLEAMLAHRIARMTVYHFR